jgi:hypothetical protein
MLLGNSSECRSRLPLIDRNNRQAATLTNTIVLSIYCNFNKNQYCTKVRSLYKIFLVVTG